MRKYILSLLIGLLSISTYAQHEYDITIGVIVPEQQKEIDANAFRLLATRLNAMMGANSVSSVANGTFVMYPIVNILDKKE